NTHHNEEEIVRKLFKNNFTPTPLSSKSFKMQVMDRVMSEWVSQSNYYEPILDKNTRWWLIPSILALFLIGYFIDMAQLGQTEIGEAFAKLGIAFESLYIWIDPIHLMIMGTLLAAGMLLGIDQLFQKLSNI
ncbi:MAG: hypothetical protein ACOCV9_06470, partial [Marinilabiliaceae bacterium]